VKPALRSAVPVIAGAAVVLCSCGGAQHHQAIARSSRSLPCRETIGDAPPPKGMTVVLGVVALPASSGMRQALQTALTGSHDPATRLFAKWGLVVRAGADFQLSLPRGQRGDATIGWGNADEGHEGTTIVVRHCRAPRGRRWLDFAGGYWVRRPVCLPLTVAAHGQTRRVSIGVGRPCAGQRPPPRPTQS
jgi:hypothetical protein